MNLKKVISLATLIGGIILCDESSMVHAIEYEPEWETSWGGSGSDSAESIIQTSDGGFLIVGTSESTDAGFISKGERDAIIVKFDGDGNQEWMNSWGGNDSDRFTSLTKTSDGGFITVGYSSSTDAGFTNQGGRDAIIIKYSPKTDADIQINGSIQTMMADVTIPSTSPDLVINPNLPEGVVSPEFEIQNDSTSPIKLSLKTFEQTTNTFNDVLPDKYTSWEGLNKSQSKDIALGLVAKPGSGWQRLTAPTSYISGHIEHEIGVIKPASSVSFEFDIHHGRAFSESKTVQYRMVFVFDLLN